MFSLLNRKFKLNFRVRGYLFLLGSLSAVFAIAGFCVGLSSLRQPKRNVGHVFRVPDAYGYIDPVVEEPTRSIEQLLLGSLFILSIPLQQTSSEITIDHVLSAQERLQIFLSGANGVTVIDGADKAVFDDPRLFWTTKRITLNCSRNESFIQSLRKSYPNTKYLMISQKSPLTSTDLRELGLHEGLECLYLDCPVNAKYWPMKSLTGCLQELRMQAATSLPPLPHLERLDIEDSAVTARFMRSLDAPRLRTLDLVNDNIDRSALESLNSSRDLRSLVLSGSSVDQGDFNCALRLPCLSIRVPRLVRQGGR